jgi:uncharacterized protein
MPQMTISLRGVVYFVLLAALGVGIGVAAGRLQDVPAAGEPVEIGWEQLIPQSNWFGGQSGRVISGMIQHGQISPLPDLTQDQSALVSDYDGKRVRIPGYIVPIGFDGVGVKEFLLVPYVGACIHVPPPPPNQIIYVQSEKRVPVRRQFEAVLVTGTFAASKLSTDLAEVGYRIAAEAVTPYVEE